MCVSVPPACMYVPMEVRFPGSGVIDGYEPSYMSWDVSPDLLQEQSILLSTEPSLSPRATLPLPRQDFPV